MTSHPEVFYGVYGMECVPLGTKQQEVMLENGTTNEHIQPSDTGGQDHNDNNCYKKSGGWLPHCLL